MTLMNTILRVLIVVAVTAVSVGELAACGGARPTEPFTESSPADSSSCSVVAPDSVAAVFGQNDMQVIQEETREALGGKEHSCSFVSSMSTWSLLVTVNVFSVSASAQELLDARLKQDPSATPVEGVGDAAAYVGGGFGNVQFLAVKKADTQAFMVTLNSPSGQYDQAHYSAIATEAIDRAPNL